VAASINDFGYPVGDSIAKRRSGAQRRLTGHTNLTHRSNFNQLLTTPERLLKLVVYF